MFLPNNTENNVRLRYGCFTAPTRGGRIARPFGRVRAKLPHVQLEVLPVDRGALENRARCSTLMPITARTSQRSCGEEHATSRA